MARPLYNNHNVLRHPVDIRPFRRPAKPCVWTPDPMDPDDRLNFESLRGAQADGSGDLPLKPGFYSDVLCGMPEYNDWMTRISKYRPGTKIVKIGDRPTGRWARCEVTYEITHDFRPEYAELGRDAIAQTGETYESCIQSYIDNGYSFG